MHGIDFCEYLSDTDVAVFVSMHLPLSWYSSVALVDKPEKVMLVSVSQFQARTAPREIEIDHTVPNGVELEDFSAPRHAGNYLLAMGRICPEKGFHLAIEAAERVDEDLILAGSVFEYPEHRAYFESMIVPKVKGNSRLHFLNSVGGRRKRPLLGGATCLLMPSRVWETRSLLAMAAVAPGTPVIGWDRGAPPHTVPTGQP